MPSLLSVQISLAILLVAVFLRDNPREKPVWLPLAAVGVALLPIIKAFSPQYLLHLIAYLAGLYCLYVQEAAMVEGVFDGRPPQDPVFLLLTLGGFYEAYLQWI